MTPPPAADLTTRRRRILDAARTVFQSQGGMSAGLRPIAAAAGVTTGAIYAVFSGKEAIYAALLEESLTAMGDAVAMAAGREAEAEAALRAAAAACVDFYVARVFERDLGLYLFETDGRKGLGPEMNARLNKALRNAVGVFQACFERLGAPVEGDPPTARDRADALFTALVGLTFIAGAGRDRSLGTSVPRLLDTIVSSAIEPTRK